MIRSPFPPERVPDPALLDDYRPLIRRLQRR